MNVWIWLAFFIGLWIGTPFGFLMASIFKSSPREDHPS